MNKWLPEGVFIQIEESWDLVSVMWRDYSDNLDIRYFRFPDDPRDFMGKREIISQIVNFADSLEKELGVRVSSWREI